VTFILSAFHKSSLKRDKHISLLGAFTVTFIMEKQCKKCQVVKPLTDYRKQSCQKDGHQNECRECMDKRARARYEEKKDQIKAASVDWSKNNRSARKRIVNRYNNSPSGKINERLNEALTRVLGKVRDIFPHIIGLSPSDLALYLHNKIPEGLTWDDYPEKWIVGVIAHAGEELTQEELHYKNLIPRIRKNDKDLDFSI
jgi:hypothetical protein